MRDSDSGGIGHDRDGSLDDLSVRCLPGFHRHRAVDPVVQEPDLVRNRVTLLMPRHFRVTERLVGYRSLARQNGVLYITPLFIATGAHAAGKMGNVHARASDVLHY